MTQREEQNELTLLKRFWSSNPVVFTAKSLIVDFDRQIDEQGGQNHREKVEERKKEFFREMMVLSNWNLNNWISIYMLF